VTEVGVSFDGSTYAWEFDNVEKAEENGELLCEWNHHRRGHSDAE